MAWFARKLFCLVKVVVPLVVEAFTLAEQCLPSHSDTYVTDGIVLTDLMNMLQKVKSKSGCPVGHLAMHNLLAEKTTVSPLP